MIFIQKLVKRMGNKIVLNNLDLKVETGETIAILGGNGAGKSTLLKILSTRIKPSSGVVKISNKELTCNLYNIRKQIGYLAHSSLLYNNFSPYANLEFYGKLYGISKTYLDKRIRNLVKEVGLTMFLHEPIKGFSRGMMQRIAIQRALIHEPSYLFLDEPHTGLDQKAVSILNNVIRVNQAKGCTTLIITHDFKQAVEICDRAIVINKGQVIADFKIKNMKEKQLIVEYNQVLKGERR